MARFGIRNTLALNLLLILLVYAKKKKKTHYKRRYCIKAHILIGLGATLRKEE